MHSPSPTGKRDVSDIPGGLYVVATPIGNLKDITLRAIHTLKNVDLIAAEDTRHTARLLSHYGIHTPLISCHEHNECQRVPELIEKIRSGGAVAIVSDAGTPLVSDPGYRLVCTAVEKGLDVFPIPGVSAVITALCGSGLATDAFLFQGFAPKKKGKRKELLTSLAHETRTLVFFESPRRIPAFLTEILHVMGDRSAVLAREMTKLHEEFIRGRVSEILLTLMERPSLKGECTLLVNGRASFESISESDLVDVLRSELSRPGVRVSSLSKALSQEHGIPRKKVYALALKVEEEVKKGPAI